jgi:hypothetical protein
MVFAILYDSFGDTRAHRASTQRGSLTPSITTQAHNAGQRPPIYKNATD